MASTKQISLDEVRKHRNRKNVWIVINNDVLDVTKFLDEHPGGADSLLEVAGTDATQAFNDVGHSSDARALTKKYKIGTVPANEMKNAQSCRSLYPRSSRERPEPCASGRVGTIVVPRERRFVSRGRSWGAGEEPEPDSWKFNLKWLLLLLGAVVVLGFAYKKYNS